jgi:hypothetical protein
MRRISHLSEVQLCGRKFGPPFDQLRWPGGRKSRAALDRAVGWMHLDDWKYQNVGDPTPYFRSALTISRKAHEAPGQKTVETVLSNVFLNKGFSATLNGNPLEKIYDDLRTELYNALLTVDKTAPITPGFEDMVLKVASRQTPVTATLVKPVPLDEPGGGAIERCALEEALGAAFIDYFNHYSVDDDLRQQFVGCGGTDYHILNALWGTFGQNEPSNFGPTFEATLSKQVALSVGGNARVVMTNWARQFGSSLNDSIKNNPKPYLDPVFADLRSLK